MANVQCANRSLLQNVQDLLLRKPNSYDVAFCVGPTKKKVKAVRILLEAASPVLESKLDLWEVVVSREVLQEGFQLPDFEPEAFEIFVKLTMLDEWTAEGLKSCNLMPNDILNLISICSFFEMNKALEHLEDLMGTFYSAFTAFKDTDDFLRLSHANLQKILSSDDLNLTEVEVFACSIRWAKSECSNRKLEATADILRLVLGDCLFEIRFPLMTTEEFLQCVGQCDILTGKERCEVLGFISNYETHRVISDASLSPFKSKPRATTVQLRSIAKVTPGFSILRLKMDSAVVDSPGFVCDGEENWNCIAPKQKILVHGVGFLGPVNGNASYDVTVQFTKWDSGKGTDMERIEKRIYARKREVFHIMFDQPIKLAECAEVDWENHKNYYGILYKLVGPNTQSFRRSRCTTCECATCDGKNLFCIMWESNQLAEILYSNMATSDAIQVAKCPLATSL